MTDYETTDAEKVIDEIIYKLQQTSKSESEFNKSLKQLIVLSRLRKLEEKIEQKVNDMPITYDIKTDGLYNKGIMEGIWEGIQKGRKKGREEGMEKREKEIALNSIETGLDNDTISKITSLTNEQIETLRKNQQERPREKLNFFPRDTPMP